MRLGNRSYLKAEQAQMKLLKALLFEYRTCHFEDGKNSVFRQRLQDEFLQTDEIMTINNLGYLAMMSYAGKSFPEAVRIIADWEGKPVFCRKRFSFICRCLASEIWDIREAAIAAIMLLDDHLFLPDLKKAAKMEKSNDIHRDLKQAIDQLEKTRADYYR